jgi:hypothetical protein
MLVPHQHKQVFAMDEFMIASLTTITILQGKISAGNPANLFFM